MFVLPAPTMRRDFSGPCTRMHSLPSAGPCRTQEDSGSTRSSFVPAVQERSWSLPRPLVLPVLETRLGRAQPCSPEADLAGSEENVNKTQHKHSHTFTIVRLLSGSAPGARRAGVSRWGNQRGFLEEVSRQLSAPERERVSNEGGRTEEARGVSFLLLR